MLLAYLSVFIYIDSIFIFPHRQFTLLLKYWGYHFYEHGLLCWFINDWLCPCWLWQIKYNASLSLFYIIRGLVPSYIIVPWWRCYLLKCVSAFKHSKKLYYISHREELLDSFHILNMAISLQQFYFCHLTHLWEEEITPPARNTHFSPCAFMWINISAMNDKATMF